MRQIQAAVIADFEILQQMLNTYSALFAFEPETAAELVKWQRDSQTVIQRILELRQQGAELRKKVRNELNAYDPEPIKDAVLEYFDTEDQYFQLAAEVENSPSVVSLHTGGAISPEVRAKHREQRDLGKALRKAQARMLDGQLLLMGFTGWSIQQKATIQKCYEALGGDQVGA